MNQNSINLLHRFYLTLSSLAISRKEEYSCFATNQVRYKNVKICAYLLDKSLA